MGLAHNFSLDSAEKCLPSVTFILPTKKSQEKKRQHRPSVVIEATDYWQDQAVHKQLTVHFQGFYLGCCGLFLLPCITVRSLAPSPWSPPFRYGQAARRSIPSSRDFFGPNKPLLRHTLQLPAMLVDGQASSLQFNEVFDIDILGSPKLDSIFWMQPTEHQARFPQPAGSAAANPVCAMNWQAQTVFCSLTATWLAIWKVPVQDFSLLNTKQNFSAQIISKQDPDLNSTYHIGGQHFIHTTSFLSC